MSMSIRLRLALWFSTVMAIALTAFGVGALWLHTRWAAAQFDSELNNLGEALGQVMQEELGESGNLLRAVRETRNSIDVADRATAILDVNGKPMAAHWHGFDADGVFAPHDRLQHQLITTIGASGNMWRVLQRPERSPAGDYTIVVAGPLERIARQRVLLSRVLLVAGSLMILVTAAVSWWVASSAIRPVSTMASEAAAISAKSPDWRLNAPSDTDELGQLARAFNDLLARLGAASRTQRQFMADASHELRTPVSVIQTATEVTLNQPRRREAEYREALTIISEQSARLSRLVQDMFVLARADAGGYHVPMRGLYVDEVVEEAVRAVAVVAAAKGLGLTWEIQPDVAIDGDDGLLHRMMTNLLDNAVQHTPTGGSVNVVLTADTATVTITVADTGPGIQEADRDRAFDRFVRLDPARSAESGGGLGLPIARWIAEQHHGTLSLEPSLRGCVFVVRLPLPRSATLHHGQAEPEHGDRGSDAKMNLT
jgi:two-component system, OmpR family, sensor kinase